MGENSKIAWCDHTFNPWIGCTKVSDGCKYCYAEEMMDKRYGKVKWGVTGTRIRTSEANWKLPLRWNRKAEKEGVRYRVFCGSLCDVLEEKDDQSEMDDWRCDLFDMIEATRYLDWLLLTKRPENIVRLSRKRGGLPISTMIGVSVENQEQAEKRIPIITKIPNTKFLSIEPLLGPMDLRIKLGKSVLSPLYLIDWVIVGGESGPNARPMQVEWAMDIRRQCKDAGVPFFMKQLGGYPNKRERMEDFPEELRVREWPE